MLDLTFGEQVKIILSRKGMTIKELAELIEDRTGKKMSRQNLTQRLGRDNFQEQDMRMIAEILECPFQLSILADSESVERASHVETVEPTEKELTKLARAKERKERREEMKEAATVAEPVEEVVEEPVVEEPVEEVVEEPVVEEPVEEVAEEPVVEEPVEEVAEEPVAEEPVQYEEEPVQYEEEPVQYEEEPVQYEEEPVQYEEEPVQYEEEPVQYEEEPVQYEEEPVQYEEEPVQYEEEPVQYEEAPVQEEEPVAEETPVVVAEPEHKEEKKAKGGWRSVFQRRPKKEESVAYEAPVQEEEPVEEEEEQVLVNTPTPENVEHMHESYQNAVEEMIQHSEEEDLEKGEMNPYTGREFESNTVRSIPNQIGFVEVYDRSQHKWERMTEWAFLGLQDDLKARLGSEYKEPIYLD